MERIVLPKRIVKQLNSFSGKTVADKIDYLAERTAASNLRECNERISRFESRYGRIFSDFASAWNRGKIVRAYDYATETDFIEWEASEQEKEHWLAVIRSLRNPRSSPDAA
jgi:hypothetical protein